MYAALHVVSVMVDVGGPYFAPYINDHSVHGILEASENNRLTVIFLVHKREIIPGEAFRGIECYVADVLLINRGLK